MHLSHTDVGRAEARAGYVSNSSIGLSGSYIVEALSSDAHFTEP